ncbi:hypothetical protein O6P43_017376 [Quillaja saponaria]|uniref:Transmembrane protein n=1 Tax=Quillaja saponaria TaxID=32244 RepID=A0AAD7LPU2_QUISA|nr:hypothetical protein O6P43_017376 [Quillaja saponaria]
MPVIHSTGLSSERASREEVKFPSPLHSIIFFLIITLSPFLQFYNKTIKMTPFDAHNITLVISVPLSIYAVLLAIEFKLETQNSSYLAVFRKFSLLTGALNVVLLLLTLFPVFGWFVFTIWVVYLIRALLCLYQQLFQLLALSVHQVLEVLKNNFTREQNGLPV